MILLTRLNGVPFAVNADLIERVETVPDTVVTLVDGHKYVVTESAAEVIERILEFRASILVVADQIQHQPVLPQQRPPRPTPSPQHPTNRRAMAAGRAQLRVVTDNDHEES